MSSPSYSAPPARPELNSSSPFYATLESYALFSGWKGLPRDVVHNSIPRRYSGPYGTALGEDPKIVAASFPFAPAADGSGTGYSVRFTGGSKALAFPHGGFNQDAGHGTVGPAHTIFSVFQIEDVGTYAFGIAQLACSYQSPFTNQGNPAQATGNGLVLGVQNGICVAASPAGSIYFGFTEESTFAQAVYPCLQAPIVQGHWYLGAVSFYSGTDTFSTSIADPRRVYLWDLTTGSLIAGASGQTSQTWGADYWPFGVNANRGYSGTFDIPASHMDLVIGPGAHPAGYGQLIGKVHLAGADQQFWDNTGQFAAIPAAFSGTDPFTTLFNDIYGPARGTYATGSGGTTLINASAQTLSNTNVISPAGQGKQAGAYSTVANVVAGVPTDLGLLFLGDCAVTKVSDTVIEITASRPQAGSAAVTGYSLYGSTTAPFTPGVGNLIATQTVSGDPMAHVFQYTPGDTVFRFFTITATDGTHTYTYPQVEAGCRPHRAVFVVTAGNSYGDSGAPWQHLARAGQAWGFDTPVLNLDFDGATVAQWTTAGTSMPTNGFGTPSGTGASLAWLQATLSREAAALGRPVDLCVCWLVENNTGDGSSAFNTEMTTMATAVVGSHLAKFAPVPYGQRALAGASSSSPPGGPGEAIGQGLASIDNGSTIVVPGSKWLNLTGALPSDFAGAHPSTYLAQMEAATIMNDYATRFAYPAATRAVVVCG